MNLGAAVDLYLGEIENPRTLWSVRGTLSPMVETFNPDTDVRAILATQLHEYFQDMRSSRARFVKHSRRPVEYRPLSPVTINNRIKAVKRFFKWVVELGALDKSPAQSLKTKKYTSQIDPNGLPDNETIDLLIEYFFGNQMWYPLLRFMVDSGCRVGAAAQLRIQDVDTNRMQARVLDEKGDRWYWVYFSTGTAKAIQGWMKRRPKWNHDYVFGTERGHLRTDSITQKWRRACDRLGLPRFKSHELRHKKGMAMAERNVSDKTIGMALGHSDNGRTAAEFYAHIREAVVREASIQTHRPALHDPRGKGRIVQFPGAG